MAEGFEVDLGEFEHGLAEGLFPLFVGAQKVGVLFGESTSPGNVEFVDGVEDHVDGWADGDVRAHGGVEGDQGVLCGDLKWCLCVFEAADEERAAVLDLAELQ